MKILQSIPYILLFISIGISTIVAAINNITFFTFFKRSIFCFFILFVSSRFLINYILETKEKNLELGALNHKNLPVEDEINTSGNSNNVEDDFTPLDLQLEHIIKESESKE
ncbi:hypothetical protein IZY60_05930 [Lutibacter sp. B2]|nr:hypothetical protein [Lutibacter sp. B2]